MIDTSMVLAKSEENGGLSLANYATHVVEMIKVIARGVDYEGNVLPYKMEVLQKSFEQLPSHGQILEESIGYTTR